MDYSCNLLPPLNILNIYSYNSEPQTGMDTARYSPEPPVYLFVSTVHNYIILTQDLLLTLFVYRIAGPSDSAKVSVLTRQRR